MKHNTTRYLFWSNIMCWRLIQILKPLCQVAKYRSEQTNLLMVQWLHSHREPSSPSTTQGVPITCSAHVILTVNQSGADLALSAFIFSTFWCLYTTQGHQNMPLHLSSVLKKLPFELGTVYKYWRVPW